MGHDVRDRLCERGDCPGAENLRAYATGDLPDPDVERVSGCAADCSRCQETLSGIEAQTDDLLEQIRAATREDSICDHCALEPLIALAAAIRVDDARTATFGGQGRDATWPNMPERIGQYRILDRIGAGGMGTVYRAKHERLQKIVALKVIAGDRDSDPDAVERFSREMQAIGRLQHRHIVNATDAGEDDGRHYLVMELVDGVNLAQLIGRLGPLPLADACEIVRQAAVAVQHAHQHGIVHRDVKPSNLMLSSEGEVKVLDLGLARLFEAGRGNSLSASGQIVGTLDYIAPEQISPAAGVDGRADIYSLGCTLFALLTGRPPFAGPDFIDPLQKMAAHVQQAPPPLAANRPGVPVGLVDAVAKMLAKRPAERHATAAELAEALQGFASGADLRLLVRRGEAAAGALSTPRAESQERAPTARRQGRRRRTWLAILVGVALLGGVSAQYGAVAFRIVTNRGTLQVAIKDDAFEGEWRNERLTLRERGSDHSYSVELKSTKATRDLPAGNYLAVSDSNGLRVEPAEFSISRGGTTLVQVKLVEATRSEAAQPPTAHDVDAAQPATVQDVGADVANVASGDLRLPQVLPERVLEWNEDRLYGENPGVSSRGQANGRYYVSHVKGHNGWLAWGQYTAQDECIIETLGRVDEGFGGAWIVNFSNRENGRGACVLVHDGWMSIFPPMFGKGDQTTPKTRRLEHRAIKGAHAFNRLQVVVRRSSLELFVNGELVYGPIEFDVDLLPVHVCLGMAGGGRDKDARVEFERFVVWPTSDRTRIAEPPAQPPAELSAQP